MLVDRTAGSPALFVRIKDAQGVWLCFRQIHNYLFERHNRQTLQFFFDKTPDCQRQATVLEKDYLCVKGAIKTRASKVGVVKLDTVCQLVAKYSQNHALVQNMASIATQEAHKIEDGSLALMRTVPSQAPLNGSTGQPESSPPNLNVPPQPL